MIYCIGDTHFLHTAIIQYCNRPENFNSLIIKNWNATVKDDDVVIHLGDVFAGLGKVKDGEIIARKIIKSLKGTKILIRGNHESYPDEWYKEIGFEEVYSYLEFDSISFCHYPLVSEYENTANKYMTKEEKEHFDKLKTLFDNSKNECLIHGHTHNRENLALNCFNTSVEVLNYKPKSLDEIKEYFKTNGFKLN